MRCGVGASEVGGCLNRILGGIWFAAATSGEGLAKKFGNWGNWGMGCV